MRKAALALISLSIAYATIGCAPAPSLVGKWNMEGTTTVQQGPMTLTVNSSSQEFKGDGTFVSTSNMSVAGQTLDMVLEGTYVVAESSVTLTPTKASINGQQLDASNPAFNALTQAAAKPVEYKFEGNSKVILTVDGKASTYNKAN